MTEEEKQNFKKNISQLNTMLKKMVPLYEKRCSKTTPVKGLPVSKPQSMIGSTGDATPVTVIGSKERLTLIGVLYFLDALVANSFFKYSSQP